MDTNNKKKELFGIDIVKLYDINLEKSYDLVQENTDYLNGISISEVKQIEFSYYRDIIILLKDGIVLLNGKQVLSDIDFLFFLDATEILAIDIHKTILPIFNCSAKTSFINNNNYRYKKIIMTPLSVVALTYEKEIKCIAPCISVGIDPTRFFNVDDIGYTKEDDEVVIIQNNKIKPLFLFAEDKLYEKKQIVLEGIIEEDSYVTII